MANMKKSEWLIVTGLLLLSFVPSVGGLLRLVELGAGSGIDFLPANPRVQNAPLPVILHLFSSIPYCVIGAFQFLQSIRQNHLRWHKVSGRLLVLLGIVSALSGLWMTHFYSFPESLQGNLLYVVRIFVSLFMVLFILLGLSSILQKRVLQHRAWMIRAYALGQGAGTQVLVAIPFLLAVGEPTSLVRDILMTIAWVINISVAEWIIRLKR